MAGELGVAMLDGLLARGAVADRGGALSLTEAGEAFVEDFGVPVETLRQRRRPVCKACLDWSERRHHLAGTLGAAMMSRFAELKWAARDTTTGSRVVNFTRAGEKRFATLFPNGEG
jgi:hypothetical protein